MTERLTGATDAALSDSSEYGEVYYSDFGGVSYKDAAHWTRFFGETADHIAREIEPETVLDVGCAMGYLVEALRERGIQAWGIDFSEYAIANVRGSVRGYCSVGSILEPFSRRYDLITCIEVVEHLPVDDAGRAIENLCGHTDDILLTSTPSDYAEETHLNVRPPEYWAELFAQQGFYRDVSFEAPYLALWATRYRRGHDPLPRVVATFERELWRLRQEAAERNRLIVKQLDDTNRARSALDENKRLEAELAAVTRRLNDHQNLLVDMEEEIRRLRVEANRLSASAVGRLVVSVQNRALRLAPPGTRRRRWLRDATLASAALVGEGPRGLMTRVDRRRHPPVDLPESDEAARVQSLYQGWLQRHQPDQLRLNQMRGETLQWTYRPRISIVMSVFNPEPGWLDEAIASVLAQVYPDWELCIADDASTLAHVRASLERFAAADPRIRVIYRETNAGIAAALNSALAMTSGDYVAFLDHDDLLRAHALYAMVDHLRSYPDAEIVYSDEDKLLESGELGEPFFKPDWSPDLLLSWNYITHLTMIRKDLLDSLGGFREGFDGSQDHDLLLRATERAKHVSHVADVLYTWRKTPRSTSVDAANKPAAGAAGAQAVKDALDRRGLGGRVAIGPLPFTYQTRYLIDGSPRVGIIIPTRDRSDLVRRCIESIRGTSTYRNYSITVIDNGSRHPATAEYLATASVAVVRLDEPFNYSKLINAGVERVDADHLLFLNNDMYVLRPDWLEALLELSQRREIGAVGARLLFPNGDVQHEGIICGRGRVAGNVNMGWPVVRETSAVTGACLMTRRDVFLEVGGFDESMPVAFNDVDFCFRVRALGYRVLFTPHAELRHEESASRGRLNPEDDRRRFTTLWGTEDRIRDPYLNANLSWPRPLEFVD